MSSSDHGRLERRRRAAGRLLALAVTAALAACTVQPLYGPAPAGSARCRRSSPGSRSRRSATASPRRSATSSSSTWPAADEVADPLYKMKLTVGTSRNPRSASPISRRRRPIRSPLRRPTRSPRAAATEIDRHAVRAAARLPTTASTRSSPTSAPEIDAENRAAAAAADEIRTCASAALGRLRPQRLPRGAAASWWHARPRPSAVVRDQAGRGRSLPRAARSRGSRRPHPRRGQAWSPSGPRLSSRR